MTRKRKLSREDIKQIIKEYNRNTPELARKYGVHTSTIARWLHRAGITILDKPIEERFWEHVIKTDDCWLWNGWRLATGYGALGFGGREYLAHRISYEINIGPIPRGYLICHHCDNPPCVRPDHLFAGTYSDNFKDAAIKHRITGERAHNVIFKQKQIDDIRALWETGNWTQDKLAIKFQTAQSHISKIVNFKQWPK